MCPLHQQFDLAGMSAFGTKLTYRGDSPFVRFRGQSGHTRSSGFDLFGRY
jgi:hypothetical protein